MRRNIVIALCFVLLLVGVAPMAHGQVNLRADLAWQPTSATSSSVNVNSGTSVSVYGVNYVSSETEMRVRFRRERPIIADFNVVDFDRSPNTSLTRTATVETTGDHYLHLNERGILPRRFAEGHATAN